MGARTERRRCVMSPEQRISARSARRVSPRGELTCVTALVRRERPSEGEPQCADGAPGIDDSGGFYEYHQAARVVPGGIAWVASTTIAHERPIEIVLRATMRTGRGDARGAIGDVRHTETRR
jgi:hypothetical protein